MKSLQDIKDEVSQEARKNRSAPFLRKYDSMIHSRTHLIEMAMDEVAKRYALEVAKETQRRCAESADLEYYDDPDHGGSGAAQKFVRVDKESILSETNIPELI